MKVGDIRRGLLFPALEIGVEWACTKVLEGASVSTWEFDGTFFGQPLFTAVITADKTQLTLDVKGAA
jgi:hypothetical protein